MILFLLLLLVFVVLVLAIWVCMIELITCAVLVDCIACLFVGLVSLLCACVLGFWFLASCSVYAFACWLWICCVFSFMCGLLVGW